MNSPFRYNKRKQFLTAGAIAYIVIGTTYILEPTPGRRAAFDWLPTGWEPQNLGWLWVVGGVAILVLGLGSRMVHAFQPVAFTILAICPAAWAGIFVGASLTGTYRPGWASSVLYCVIVLWSVIVAGWDNPRREGATTTELPIAKRGDE